MCLVPTTVPCVERGFGIPRSHCLKRQAKMSIASCVWLTGFEPATPCPPSRCATKLRHSQIQVTRQVDLSRCDEAHLSVFLISEPPEPHISEG